MIVVHHAPKSRSTRVVWMLEEMGLPYETRIVEPLGERSEAFLDANPARMLPLVEDGAERLVESTAILQYLGERHGPSPLVAKPADANYPQFLQYLHLGEASLGGLLTVPIVTNFVAPEEHKANWGAGAARDIVGRRFSLVSKALADNPYVAGPAFTAADISVAWPIGIAKMLGMELAPDLDAYLDRMQARPAYQRAAAVN
jgi:glutathione S-transferase